MARPFSSADISFRNAILSRQSPEVLRQLAPQPVDLNVNDVLYEPNVPFEYCYFPETGVMSIVSLMENGHSIEVGTVGREGMSGATLLLETESLPYRCFIQVGGRGHRVSATALKQTAESHKEFRTAILRHEATFRTQTMQGMACNGLHTVEQRCCRWLLMTRDRVDADDLKLTHEFLGLMLGVRRSSVSEVLAPMQERGLVSSNRGTITILDRAGLEARVCECYWVMVQRERAP